MRFYFWLALLLLVIIRIFFSRGNYLEGQKIRITAPVLTEPTKFSFYQTLRLSGLKISLPIYPEIHYGDKVVIEGTVSGGQLTDAVLKNIKEENNFLTGLRKSLVEFYKKSLPEPHASLMSGIVLGARGSFPPVFWNSIKSTGVAHVVVASGMNVSMVAGFLLSLGILVFPRRKALILALAGIWFYVIIVGLEAPIVRAALMGSIAFIAEESGRLSRAVSILLLSILIMLITFPGWISDIGFILSFVATFSLMIFEKRIRERLKGIPAFLREGLSTSLAAQIGVAPILFVTFGQFNPLSPLINAIVLWTIPPVMVIGAVGGVVGLLLPMLGQGVLYLAYPLTWWFTSIVNLFG